MRRRSPQPGRRSNRSRGNQANGLTLIELLGALALLATLLTAMLSARGDAMRQHTRAQRKLQAIDYADQLLTAWWPSATTLGSTPEGAATTDSAEGGDGGGSWGFLRQGTGRHRQWELTWQTATVDHEPIAALGGQVVRLTVRDERLPLSAAPLVSVDVVLPLPLDEASGLAPEGR